MKEKKNYNELKKLFSVELSFMINMIEEGDFSRQEIFEFAEKKETANAKSFYDYLMIFQFMKTFSYVLDNYKKIALDMHLIQKLHKMIFDEVDCDAGNYRKGKLTYFGLKLKTTDTASLYSDIKLYESKLSKKEGLSLTDVFDLHHQFLILAPFKKGNFHIAFLLLAILLLKNGYTPLVIRTIDKKRYFEVLENYQLKNKNDAYYTFMSQALYRSFQLLLNNPEEVIKKENLLTISKFAKLCDVPVSTIRYWMKEGHLKPVVFTSTGYALFDEAQRIDIQEAKLTKMISKCMSTLKKGVEKSLNQINN